MCNAIFTSEIAYRLDSLDCKLDRNGGNPQFVVSTAHGVVEHKIPESPGTPLAAKVIDGMLHFGKVDLRDGCVLTRNDVVLKGDFGTFLILRNGGGIGISDTRDGRLTIVNFDLRETFVLFQYTVAGGDLRLIVQSLERTLAGNMTTHSIAIPQ